MRAGPFPPVMTPTDSGRTGAVWLGGPGWPKMDPGTRIGGMGALLKGSEERILLRDGIHGHPFGSSHAEQT